MQVGGFIFGDLYIHIYICEDDLWWQPIKLLPVSPPALRLCLQHLYRDIFSSLGGRGNVAASFIYDVGLKKCKNTHT